MGVHLDKYSIRVAWLPNCYLRVLLGLFLRPSIFMNSTDSVLMSFIVSLICMMVASIVIGLWLLVRLHVLQPEE